MRLSLACIVLGSLASNGFADERCPDGTTKANNICVSQRMADYVACVATHQHRDDSEIVREIKRESPEGVYIDIGGAGHGVFGGGSGQLKIDTRKEQRVAEKVAEKFSGPVDCLKALELAINEPQSKDNREVPRSKNSTAHSPSTYDSNSRKTPNCKVKEPYVDLSMPLDQQVQLFAGDQITVMPGEHRLIALWIGASRILYDADDARTYLVAGNAGVPIIPAFDVPNGGHVKLKITPYGDCDKPREIKGGKGSANAIHAPAGWNKIGGVSIEFNVDQGRERLTVRWEAGNDVAEAELREIEHGADMVFEAVSGSRPNRIERTLTTMPNSAIFYLYADPKSAAFAITNDNYVFDVNLMSHQQLSYDAWAKTKGGLATILAAIYKKSARIEFVDDRVGTFGAQFPYKLTPP